MDADCKTHVPTLQQSVSMPTTEPATPAAPNQNVPGQNLPDQNVRATESACPPPLAWVDVLADFHRQAEAWYLDRPNYRLSGRTLGSGPPLYFLNGFSGTHEL